MKAALCVEMGWTSQEFDAQPWEFIDAVLQTFKDRAHEIEIAQRRAEMNR